MKIPILALLVASVLTASADPLLQPNDKLAFCGDSMTGGLYTNYIERYLIACQPGLPLDMKQFGWSAETPDAFLTRIDKDLTPWKPTVVTLLYNFGDDGQPLNQTAVDARSKSETALIDALKKSGIRAIVLGSPPCADSTLYHHDPAKAAAYNTKLAAVAAADKAVAAQEGIAYADVFGASTAMMANAKTRLGADYNYAGDDIRQQQDGLSIAIAYAFLKAFNLNGDIGTFTVHFNPDHLIEKVETSGDPKIITPDPVTAENAPGPHEYDATLSRYTFCIPGHQYPDVLMSCLPFYQDLSSLKIVATGLPGPQARVQWNENSTWHDFDTADLEKGAQLPGNMFWPYGGKFENMNRYISDQLAADTTAGKAAAAGTPNPTAEAAASAAQARTWVVPTQFYMRVFPLIAPDPKPTPPINVVFDTDMASDVDDVGALALLNDFMCQGECNLLAVVTNCNNGDSGATAHAINTYYHHDAIPVGSYLGEGNPAVKSTLDPVPAGQGYHGNARKDGSHYTVAIHKQFDPDFPTDDKLPAGVDIYRQALASAPDGSVTIVSVGAMPNVQDLLQSKPDSVSPLNGMDLIKAKVRELVIMANTTVEDGYLLGKWPTKIKWTTEAGSYVGTGQSLINTPETNPVRVAYGLFGDPEHNALKDSRASWDLTASWLAVRGVGDLWVVLPDRQQYINDITKTPFVLHPNESTITFKMKNEDVAKLINDELARPPK